jgi:hypothetical protein
MNSDRNGPKKPYSYYAYGLNIESEIECPLLTAGSSTPDVIIRLGAVPHELEQAQKRKAFYEIGDGVLLLKVDKVARFLVSDGKEIIIDPLPDAAVVDLHLFLLGSAMGALLHQRGIWPLHGSAVAGNSGAVLFVGDRGMGKSTLAGAFHQRGFQALADDVCAITTGSDGVVQVWPAIPRFKLWADSVVQLGGEPDELARTHSTLEKFALPLPQFGRDPVDVHSIYVLHQSDDQEKISLLPLKGFDKIQELTTNTYRLPFLTDMQLAPQHFQQAQALARQARVVRVTRPTQPFLLDELVEIIERDLAK